MNMGTMDDMMGGMMWSAHLWMALIGVLLVLAAVLVVRAALGYAQRGSRPPPAIPSPAADTDEALTILRRRYAQGKIGDDEFLNRRSMLKP